MKRPLRPEEKRLWSQVAKTVRTRPGRKAAHEAEEAVPAPAAKARTKPLPPKPEPTLALAPFEIGSKVSAKPAPRRRAIAPEPEPIEPGRKRRITRERDPIEARIDLHGLDQFAAEDRLKAFLMGAQARGYRAVLVITGKGSRGDGIIRRRTPEWLADPSLRDIVAGVSSAHRRHGGEGAIYVTIKRKPLSGLG